MGRGGRPSGGGFRAKVFFRRPGAMGMVDGGMIGSGFARGQRYRRGGRIAGSRGGEREGGMKGGRREMRAYVGEVERVVQAVYML